MQPFANRGDLIFFAVLFVWWMTSITIKWYRNQPQRRAEVTKNRRGFEVKLTTGETPVLKQKENDHG